MEGGTEVIEESSVATPSVWATPIQTEVVQLSEVMSEELARDLHIKEEKKMGIERPGNTFGALQPAGIEETDCDSDFALACQLQAQFDDEHDTILTREQNKLNGSSKVSVSYHKYSLGFGQEDSEEEIDQDDYKRDWDRFEVFNTLKVHADHDTRKKGRIKDKQERSTALKAIDETTRKLLFKLLRNETLTAIHGNIFTGKESVILHAGGGSVEENQLPENVIVKVFKTSLNEFKTRSKYIKGDKRFRDRISTLNPRKLIHLWVEKEARNLYRMNNNGILCPTVYRLKKHLIIMSFIGSQGKTAPKLRDAAMSKIDLKDAYKQVVQILHRLYNDVKLVHADMSEYNLLWHEGKVWVIDVSLSVDPLYPHALEFLYRDCCNMVQFFRKRGVTHVMSAAALFTHTTNLPLSEDEAFIREQLETHENTQQERMGRRHFKGDNFEAQWAESKIDEESSEEEVDEIQASTSSARKH